MVEVLTFEEALQLEPDKNRRHLLLGNGFSIACKSDIFYMLPCSTELISAIYPLKRVALSNHSTPKTLKR